MELIVRELGQSFLALIAGGAVITLFLWLLECVTAF